MGSQMPTTLDNHLLVSTFLRSLGAFGFILPFLCESLLKCQLSKYLDSRPQQVQLTGKLALTLRHCAVMIAER